MAIVTINNRTSILIELSPFFFIYSYYINAININKPL